MVWFIAVLWLGGIGLGELIYVFGRRQLLGKITIPEFPTLFHALLVWWVPLAILAVPVVSTWGLIELSQRRIRKPAAVELPAAITPVQPIASSPPAAPAPVELVAPPSLSPVGAAAFTAPPDGQPPVTLPRVVSVGS